MQNTVINSSKKLFLNILKEALSIKTMIYGKLLLKESMMPGHKVKVTRYHVFSMYILIYRVLR